MRSALHEPTPVSAAMWNPCNGSTRFALFVLARLVPQGSGDSLDIEAQLYRDSNCFERVQDLTLLDGGCYANVYSNLTRAFLVKIVGFGTQERFDIYDYIGTCHREYQYTAIPRSVEGGLCRRFVGPYYANLRSSYRSSTCVGNDCSKLNVVTQSFFTEAGCVGLAYQTFRYPMQGACLRWSNGTQTFNVDATYSNISQVDYVMNDDCTGGFTRTYAITNGRCYSLYPTKAPRSFSWNVEGNGVTSVSVNGAVGANAQAPVLLAAV
eukprot:CAMPEP_0171132624 /NCGR_PEP_ID=MMETSP0766_2-20121228/124884_1 /TAXON_ID=439317 /ORGANISM="Gambierdiscus australes, Strain CAWD 149" /LENGTH=265 /DNA_ID=CAMNT_0011595973 /DNA_START=8 /DNA_END=801 /DNA_ORIENTATION=+